MVQMLNEIIIRMENKVEIGGLLKDQVKTVHFRKRSFMNMSRNTQKADTRILATKHNRPVAENISSLVCDSCTRDLRINMICFWVLVETLPAYILLLPCILLRVRCMSCCFWAAAGCGICCITVACVCM